MTRVFDILGLRVGIDEKRNSQLSINFPYLWRLGDFDKFSGLLMMSIGGSTLLLIAALVINEINAFYGGKFSYYTICVSYVHIASIVAPFLVVVRGLFIYGDSETAERDGLLTQIPTLRQYISGTILYAVISASLLPVLLGIIVIKYIMDSMDYNFYTVIVGALTVGGCIGVSRHRRNFVRSFTFDRPLVVVATVLIAVTLVPLVKVIKWLPILAAICGAAYLAIYIWSPLTLDKLAEIGSRQSESLLYLSNVAIDAFDRAKYPLFIIWLSILATSLVAALARLAYLCRRTIIDMPANSAGIEVVEMVVSMAVSAVALALLNVDAVFGGDYCMIFSFLAMILNAMPVYIYDLWLQNLAEDPL